jgi:hypothetical protein
MPAATTAFGTTMSLPQARHLLAALTWAVVMVLDDEDDEAAPRAMSSPVAGSTAMSELDTLQECRQVEMVQPLRE